MITFDVPVEIIPLLLLKVIPPADEVAVPVVPVIVDNIVTATLAALVIRPVESTATTGICVAPPYVPAVAPDVGNLAEENVPVIILLALVVFVVADVANPETCDAAIAIIVLETDVTWPDELTVTIGRYAEFP